MSPTIEKVLTGRMPFLLPSQHGQSTDYEWWWEPSLASTIQTRLFLQKSHDKNQKVVINGEIERGMTLYPRNWVPTGLVWTMRHARASFSISGGGLVSLSFLMSLHVTRVGMQARSGGMRNRTPEWRQPHIAPPRASTTKLIRKLQTRATLRDCVRYVCHPW